MAVGQLGHRPRYPKREDWIDVVGVAGIEYYDGRCEALAGGTAAQPRIGRCKVAAKWENEDGHAVCDSHRASAAKNGYDPKAAEFRFGHFVEDAPPAEPTELQKQVAAIRAQWDF